MCEVHHSAILYVVYMLLSYVDIEILLWLFLIRVFGVTPLQMQSCSKCAALEEEVEKLKQRIEEIENLHGMPFFASDF